LVSLSEIYADAQTRRCAIGQFNVSNLEFVQAVLAAAEQTRSPVIIAASQSALAYAGTRNLAEIVKTAAADVAVPVALHLDHGPSLELAVACIEAGFTSVMIDGSHCTLDENIRVTREVVDYAHERNVTVEAELGRLGGIEDNIKVDARDASLTDPDEAERFVNESGCDALAIAVGTSHGAYKFKDEVRLDFERIRTIKERLGIPLVLHGASGVPAELVEKFLLYGGRMGDAKGVPDEAYKQAIACGINKINIDTDLRLAFAATLRQVVAEQPQVFDPRKLLAPTRAAVQKIAASKMKLFGSAGWAGSQALQAASVGCHCACAQGT